MKAKDFIEVIIAVMITLLACFGSLTIIKIALSNSPSAYDEHFRNNLFIKAETAVYGLSFARYVAIEDYRRKSPEIVVREDKRDLMRQLLRYVNSVYQLGGYVNKSTFCDLYYYDKDTSDLIESESLKANHIRWKWTAAQTTFMKHWLLDDLNQGNIGGYKFLTNDRLKKYHTFDCSILWKHLKKSLIED